MLVPHRFESFVERLRRVLFRVVLGGDRKRPAVAGRPFPHHEDFEFGSGELRLMGGPLQRSDRRRRGVDPYDDPVGGIWLELMVVSPSTRLM